MRSRREGDSRDHYSQTDRDPKRRRSDPMRDDHMDGTLLKGMTKTSGEGMITCAPFLGMHVLRRM